MLDSIVIAVVIAVSVVAIHLILEHRRKKREWKRMMEERFKD